MYLRLKDPPNEREMKFSEGGKNSEENGGRKMIYGLRNLDIRPECLRGHKIQSGSILKIKIKFSKKKTNGKRQISCRESYRWGFAVEV